MTDALRLPLPQSPQFARACASLGAPLRRFAPEDAVVWQVQSRRLGWLGRVDLLSRGPVARDSAALDDWPERLRHWHDGGPLVVNADGLSPEALRAGGFWPLMTPATVALLPLSDGATMRAALHQKWRNRLNRAEQCGLTVVSRALSPRDWLLAAEARQARARGYRGLPPRLSAAFAAANPGAARVFEARRDGAPVAAALVLRHGRMATWQIGHSGAEGRKANAMNLVLWTAMTALAAQGHDTLDLGTLETEGARGLARFKLGTGARAHRMGGTWLHLGALAPLARHLPAPLAR